MCNQRHNALERVVALAPSAFSFAWLSLWLNFLSITLKNDSAMWRNSGSAFFLTSREAFLCLHMVILSCSSIALVCLPHLQVQDRLEQDFKQQAYAETKGEDAKSKKSEYRDKCKKMKELLKNPETASRIPGYVRPVYIEGHTERPMVVLSEDKK